MIFSQHILNPNGDVVLVFQYMVEMLLFGRRIGVDRAAVAATALLHLLFIYLFIFAVTFTLLLATNPLGNLRSFFFDPH